MDPRHIDDWTYPMKLTPALKQVFMMKISELNIAHREKRDRLLKPIQDNYSRKVLRADLPLEDQRDLARWYELKAQSDEVSKRLQVRYQNWTEAYCWLPADPALEQRGRMELAALETEIRKEHEAQMAELLELAREVIAARIREVKTKIPKNLVDKLDAIGTDRQLTEGKAVIDV